MKTQMKTKSLSQKATYWLGVVAVGLVFGMGLQIAQSWVNPPAGAPANNIGAPLNTGNVHQTKGAGLTLNSNDISENGLVVARGDVGIGTENPEAKLEVDGDIKGNGALRGRAGMLTAAAGACLAIDDDVVSEPSKRIGGRFIRITDADKKCSDKCAEKNPGGTPSRCLRAWTLQDGGESHFEYADDSCNYTTSNGGWENICCCIHKVSGVSVIE